MPGGLLLPGQGGAGGAGGAGGSIQTKEIEFFTTEPSGPPSVSTLKYGVNLTTGQSFYVDASGNWTAFPLAEFNLNTTMSNETGSLAGSSPLSPPTNPDTGDLHQEIYDDKMVWFNWNGTTWIIAGSIDSIITYRAPVTIASWVDTPPDHYIIGVPQATHKVSSVRMVKMYESIAGGLLVEVHPEVLINPTDGSVTIRIHKVPEQRIEGVLIIS